MLSHLPRKTIKTSNFAPAHLNCEESVYGFRWLLSFSFNSTLHIIKHHQYLKVFLWIYPSFHPLIVLKSLFNPCYYVRASTATTTSPCILLRLLTWHGELHAFLLKNLFEAIALCVHNFSLCQTRSESHYDNKIIVFHV